jgi:hypothetical protein
MPCLDNCIIWTPSGKAELPLLEKVTALSSLLSILVGPQSRKPLFILLFRHHN